MKFDWKKFCNDYRVPYVTQGTNTARGNISIKCPYCGQADSSEHLGLKLNVHDPAWHCWRNTTHAGRNPRRLIQKLLGCSFKNAQSVVDDQLVTTPEQEELEKATDAMRSRNSTESLLPRSEPIDLTIPPEFRPLDHSHYGKLFLKYLSVTRGFGEDATAVGQYFNLYYALTGKFAWRLIIPFYAANRLIGWTGRDIRRDAKMRYRTEGNKRMIFNADAVVSNCVLLIAEGPMDAMKLHYYGQHHGYAAVATLGTSIAPEQIPLLVRLIQRCKSAVILFDRETLALGMSLAEQLQALSGRPVRSRHLVEFKDPGDIPGHAVRQVCEAVSVI